MTILKKNLKQYDKNLQNDILEKLEKLAQNNLVYQAQKGHFFMNNQQYPNTKNFKWFRYFFFKKPINLLFSLDQFLFEFSKKQPQKRRSSEFQQQLKEKKKITLFYGNLSKKELTKIIEKTKKYQGYFYRNFFSLLERRLDVVLYRCGFAKTISVARQLITHKKILINNKIVTIPGYIVQSGDCISVQAKYTDSLSNNILLSLKRSLKKRRSLINFDSKFIKNKYFLFGTNISQNFFKKFNNIKNNKKSYKTIKSLMNLLLKKINSRAYLKIKQKSIVKFNNYLTLIKYKPLLSNQAKFLLFSLKKNNYLLSDKKPFFNHSKNLFFLKERQRKIINKRYKKFNTKLSLFEKKNMVLYRNLILKIFVLMNSQKIFKYFLISGFKKYFFKKRFSFQNVKSLKFGGLKPLHLEVSYSLLKIIFLYSPQRIKFPFYINIDLLARSFK